MASDKTFLFLRSKEWSTGNGQCPECYGKDPKAEWQTNTVGHQKGCSLAESLEEMGKPVIWERYNFERDEREKDPNNIRAQAAKKLREWGQSVAKDCENLMVKLILEK